YLCLCLSPYIGKTGALCTAFLMAISPTMVYFSSFIRNDIYIAVYCVGILLALLNYTETKKYYYWYVASVLLSLAFYTKEVAYFAAFSFISFGILYWMFTKRFFPFVSLRVRMTISQHWQPMFTSFFILLVCYQFLSLFLRWGKSALAFGAYYP